jgi:hypothetical protein
MKNCPFIPFTFRRKATFFSSSFSCLQKCILRTYPMARVDIRILTRFDYFSSPRSARLVFEGLQSLTLHATSRSRWSRRKMTTIHIWSHSQSIQAQQEICTARATLFSTSSSSSTCATAFWCFSYDYALVSSGCERYHPEIGGGLFRSWPCGKACRMFHSILCKQKENLISDRI